MLTYKRAKDLLHKCSTPNVGIQLGYGYVLVKFQNDFVVHRRFAPLVKIDNKDNYVLGHIPYSKAAVKVLNKVIPCIAKLRGSTVVIEHMQCYKGMPLDKNGNICVAKPWREDDSEIFKCWMCNKDCATKMCNNCIHTMGT